MEHFSSPADFQTHIFSWWETHKRDLPWRHTSDPYRILVSEMMLQQTQVSRVVEKYREFLRIFPDINSLAHASTADVIRAWKGLGYNRRAVYLKRAAEVLMNIHNGILPETENDLKKILAYSSVENLGMITLTLGICQLCKHYPLDGVASVLFAALLFFIAQNLIISYKV